MGKPAIMHQKPYKFESKNLAKITSSNFSNCIAKLEHFMTIRLLKTQLLFAIHLDYIWSMQTLDDCKKYIESTVGTVTDVKPVISTVNIFAVHIIVLRKE